MSSSVLTVPGLLSASTAIEPLVWSESRGRPTRYRAKIAAVVPDRLRTEFENCSRCFLGVSLENANFTRAKVEGMAEWISRRFAECTVLVGDSIHRITLETVRGIEPTAALVEATRLGENFIAEMADAFTPYSDLTAFSFETCASIQTTHSYANAFAQVRAEFATNAHFRSSVEAFGKKYHSKPQRAPGVFVETLRANVQRSTDYFLEEFSIFSCLRERGISVMVYPGEFSTLSEIVSGAYPAIYPLFADMTVVSLQLKGR